jgi:hypothetical protein
MVGLLTFCLLISAEAPVEPGADRCIRAAEVCARAIMTKDSAEDSDDAQRMIGDDDEGDDDSENDKLPRLQLCQAALIAELDSRAIPLLDLSPPLAHPAWHSLDGLVFTLCNLRL